MTYLDDLDKFDPAQARDARGRWTAGSGGARTTGEPPKLLREARFHLLEESYKGALSKKLSTGELEDLKNAFDNYQRGGYTGVNMPLRGTPMPISGKKLSLEPVQKDIDIIDKGFVPSVKSAVLFRGLGTSQSRFDAYRAGSKIVDHGYMSTSTSFEVSRHFTAFNKAKYMMRIIVPRGTPMAVPSALTDIPGEKEVLLPRGTVLKPLTYHVIKFNLPSAPQLSPAMAHLFNALGGKGGYSDDQIRNKVVRIHLLTVRLLEHGITKVVPYKEAEPYRHEDGLIAGNSGAADDHHTVDTYLTYPGSEDGEIEQSGPNSRNVHTGRQERGGYKSDDLVPGSKTNGKSRPRVV